MKFWQLINMQLIIWSFALLSRKVQAKGISVLIGPASYGQGGSNPLSIPPLHPLDWQFSYVNAQEQEWIVSLVPGLLYGQRFIKDGFYVALGGGLLFSRTGLGLGLDHAFGYETQKSLFTKFHYLIEYRQVVGIGDLGWQFPYTFRIGLNYAI